MDNIAKNNRIPVMDVIKGILPLFVINTHYIWTREQTLTALFPFWNNMAVPFFMMISGYVYAKSFENKVDCFENAYELGFVLKKLVRYIIPFLIIVILEVISLSLVGQGQGIRGWIESICTGGEGPGSYYVIQMLQFVFFYPVIYFTMRKNPKRGLFGWLLFNFIYEFFKEIVHLDWGVYRLVFFRFVFIVAVGTYLYLDKEEKKTWKLVASFIVGFLFLLATNYLGYYTRIISTKASDVSFMAAFYVAPILYVLVTKCKNISCKPLALIGQASFNVFLFQMFYFNFADLIYNKVETVPIRLVINTVISVLGGIVFYYMENKLTKFVVSKIK